MAGDATLEEVAQRWRDLAEGGLVTLVREHAAGAAAEMEELAVEYGHARFIPRTGRLIGSISGEVEEMDGGAVARLGAGGGGVDYAAVQELGSLDRPAGGGGIRAKYFLRDAWLQVAGGVPEAMGHALGQALLGEG